MQYRTNEKNADKLSLLGFGCMRFPKEEQEAIKQVHYAIEKGINYFDTAYIYPKSETILGKALAGGYREKVKIATKLPHYFVKRESDFDKYFSTHLTRLQTNYIDYYFIHMLSTPSDWQRLVDLGIVNWIKQKKQTKQIINLGFSFHGSKESFEKIIDMYEWDFCMIQYNYLDENNQAGKAGLDYATQKKIPVMVMEPLRGGKLVNKLPKPAQMIFDQAPQKFSNANWAFRWVFNHPNVLTVLSGMNSIAMIDENVEIASDTQPNSITDQEKEIYQKVKKAIQESVQIPCTGCNYCMPCPFGVDIPMCFNCFNDRVIDSKLQAKFYYITRVRNHNAAKCTGCKQCEKHCPQSIKISSELQKVKKVMEGFTYKPMKFVVQKVMRQK